MKSVVKYSAAVLAITIVGMTVAVYFTATDPHDAPLWSAWLMGYIGLVLGVLTRRRK